MNCKKCNSILEDCINICPECGYTSVICTKCGYHNSPDFNYCEICGNPLNETVPTPLKKEQKTFVYANKKKYIKPAAIAASALIIILIASIFLLFKQKKDPPVLYIKDNKIFLLSSDSNKKKIIDTLATDRYINTATISDNGKRLFYACRLKDTDSSLLKFANINLSNKSDVVDSEVNTFRINKRGTIVYYTKKINRELYVSNLKEKTKIDINVDYFCINKKGTKVVYVKQDDLYMYAHNEKTLIAEDATFIRTDNTLNNIYYLMNNNVYCHTKLNKVKVIIKDVYNIIKVCNEDEVFYQNIKNELCYYYKGKTNVLAKNYSKLNFSAKSVLVFENSSDEVYVAYKGKANKINKQGANRYIINRKGTKVYFSLDDTKKGKDVYVYDVAKKTCKLYQKDISYFGLIWSSGKLVFIKNSLDVDIEGNISPVTSSDLFLEEKKIASFIDPGYLFETEDGSILYRKYNKTYLYNGKKSVKITDDENIRFFYINKNYMLLRLKTNEGKNDLYCFDGKSRRLIEKDVTALIPVNSEYYYADGFYDSFSRGYDIFPLSLYT